MNAHVTGAEEGASMGSIVYVEWRDGRPFDIHYRRGNRTVTVDVELCKRDGLLFWHISGGMPYTGDGPGLEQLPASVRTFDQIVDHYGLIEEYTEWCSVCSDFIPRSNMCAHVNGVAE